MSGDVRSIIIIPDPQMRQTDKSQSSNNTAN